MQQEKVKISSSAGHEARTSKSPNGDHQDTHTIPTRKAAYRADTPVTVRTGQRLWPMHGGEVVLSSAAPCKFRQPYFHAQTVNTWLSHLEKPPAPTHTQTCALFVTSARCPVLLSSLSALEPSTRTYIGLELAEGKNPRRVSEPPVEGTAKTSSQSQALHDGSRRA